MMGGRSAEMPESSGKSRVEPVSEIDDAADGQNRQYDLFQARDGE